MFEVKFKKLVVVIAIFAFSNLSAAQDYNYASVLDNLNYQANFAANVMQQNLDKTINLELDFNEPDNYQFQVDSLSYDDEVALDVSSSNLLNLKQTQIDALNQYHFYTSSNFVPYLGAGLNYSKFSAASFCNDLDTIKSCAHDKSSLNAIVQAGFNYGLGQNLHLNFEAKMPFSNLKYDLDTDNNLEHSTISNKLDYSPLILGFGIGYSF